MRTIWRNATRLKGVLRQLLIIAAGLFLAVPAFAQRGGSPWENAVNVLQQAFTSTIARGLSLVAIVVAGLTFAFGEGGSKRILGRVKGVLQRLDQRKQLSGDLIAKMLRHSFIVPGRHHAMTPSMGMLRQ